MTTSSWITITAPDSTVLDLDDRVNTILETDARGLLMPTFEFGIESLTQNLSRYQQVKASKRVLELPVMVLDSTQTLLEARIAAISKALNPLLGASALTITRKDGTQRVLTCRYLSGLEGDWGNGQFALTWQRFILNFQAIDPAWYAAVPTVETYSCAPAGAFFTEDDDDETPFLPLNLSESTVVSKSTITNPGDFECWPIWQITGPGDGLILRNLTTGKNLFLPIAIAPSEIITIDMTPDQKSVLSSLGTNYFPQMARVVGSALWSLICGDNEVQVELNNTISDQSLIELAFQPAYVSS